MLPKVTALTRNLIVFTRSAMGCCLGMQIYRSMRNSAENIRLEISKLRHIYVSKKKLKIPEPDARFFNAILDIVGRHPLSPRKVSRGPGSLQGVLQWISGLCLERDSTETTQPKFVRSRKGRDSPMGPRLRVLRFHYCFDFFL